MGAKRARLAWMALALALAVAVSLLLIRPRAGEKYTAAGRAAAVPGIEEPSRLADRLNSPATDVRADLHLVDQLFVAYRSALRTGNPVGENVEITAALQGRNKLWFAFIPP